MSLVMAAAGLGDPADAETDDLAISDVSLRLIARDMEGAAVRPTTSGAVGRGRYCTRSGAEERGIVAGLKGREREVRDETMLRVRLLRHFSSAPFR
jgi:hypothetical protein